MTWCRRRARRRPLWRWRYAISAVATPIRTRPTLVKFGGQAAVVFATQDQLCLQTLDGSEAHVLASLELERDPLIRRPRGRAAPPSDGSVHVHGDRIFVISSFMLKCYRMTTGD